MASNILMMFSSFLPRTGKQAAFSDGFPKNGYLKASSLPKPLMPTCCFWSKAQLCLYAACSCRKFLYFSPRPFFVYIFICICPYWIICSLYRLAGCNFLYPPIARIISIGNIWYWWVGWWIEWEYGKVSVYSCVSHNWWIYSMRWYFFKYFQLQPVCHLVLPVFYFFSFA